MIGERDPEKIRLFCAEKLRQPPMEFLSWEEVEDLLRGGHEIGSHTLTHSNLARVSEEEMEREIVDSFHRISRRVGRPKHFAWPLGRFGDFTPQAARKVFEAGFISCASAQRGCHVAGSSPRNLCVRRDGILPRWPLSHTLYFLARNARRASFRDNLWPSGWSERIEEKVRSASFS